MNSGSDGRDVPGCLWTGFMLRSSRRVAIRLGMSAPGRGRNYLKGIISYSRGTPPFSVSQQLQHLWRIRPYCHPKTLRRLVPLALKSSARLKTVKLNCRRIIYHMRRHGDV